MHTQCFKYSAASDESGWRIRIRHFLNYPLNFGAMIMSEVGKFPFMLPVYIGKIDSEMSDNTWHCYNTSKAKSKSVGLILPGKTI